LRLDHRKLKNSRNPGALTIFEKEIFDWPVKPSPEISTGTGDDEDAFDAQIESPDHNENTSPGDEQSQRSDRATCTTSGRATGEYLVKTLLNIWTLLINFLFV
jgi:hypothetical protein